MEQGIIRLTGYWNNGGCELATEMLAGIHSLSKSLNHAIIGLRYPLECPINGSGPLVYTPGFILHPISSWAFCPDKEGGHQVCNGLDLFRR